MNKVLKERIFASGQRLQIVHGDLTLEDVDAIVNAGNAHLEHGGGVAGAIVRRGGPRSQAESDAWVHKYGPVPHNKPAYTSAGNLPCRYVIHSVGPIWGSGAEDTKLSTAVIGLLELADTLELTSIAFPAISTGIFGFPKGLAATVILEAIQTYFTQKTETSIRDVRLTLNNHPTINAFIQAWESLYPKENK